MGSIVSLENEGPECPPGNGPHCFEHGWYCCHCGARQRDLERERSKAEPQGSEPSSTDLHKWKRCDQCRHPQHASACTMCGCLAVTSLEDIAKTCRSGGGCSKHPKTVLFEKYEESKPKPCVCGPDEACGDPCTPVARSADLPCVCGHRQDGHVSFEKGGCMGCTCGSFRLAPEEPPLTPEEEEEAPEDEPGPEHVCETYYCPTVGEVESACHGGFDVCCSAPEKHLPADQAPKPPQPERRAPYVATYSVGGHLYEVAVPGDACLQAVDGALVIRHGLGPVAALVAFQPMTVEEQR